MNYKPAPVLNVCLPDEDSTNLKYRVSSWHSTRVSVRHKVVQYFLFLRASPGAASPLSFIVLSMFVGELSLQGLLEQVFAYLTLEVHLKH